MVAVPADTPNTTPVVRFANAIPGALLLHVPSVIASLKEVESPVQTVFVPNIPVGV